MTHFQEQVLNLQKQGFTNLKICKTLNCPKTSVSSVFQRFDIPLNERNYEFINTVNHNYFDNIDSKNKAYFLGFFIADGCYSKTRFDICIQEGDRIVLDTLKSELNVPSDVFLSNTSTPIITRKNQVKLRWTSKYMSNSFTNVYNILENKTYFDKFKFPFDKIPKEYWCDFIRGFIDGDGSFEHNGKGTFTVRLVSTSQSFLIQIGKIIQEEIPGYDYTIVEVDGKTINWFVLTLNSHRIEKDQKVFKFYKFLYEDSDLFLIRKKNKIESYLKYRGKL